MINVKKKKDTNKLHERLLVLWAKTRKKYLLQTSHITAYKVIEQDEKIRELQEVLNSASKILNVEINTEKLVEILKCLNIDKFQLVSKETLDKINLIIVKTETTLKQIESEKTEVSNLLAACETNSQKNQLLLNWGILTPEWGIKTNPDEFKFIFKIKGVN